MLDNVRDGDAQELYIETREQARQSARSLVGRVSLVTGSTSGIGLGIARALAGAGASVVLNGFGKPEEIVETNAKLASQFNVCVSYSGADPIALLIRAPTAGE